MSRLDFLNKIIPMLDDIIAQADVDHRELDEMSHNARNNRQARAWAQKAQAYKDTSTAMTRLRLELDEERQTWTSVVPDKLIKPYSRRIYSDYNETYKGDQS